MEKLADFNATLVAEFLSATLIEETPKMWRLYEFQWGKFEIYENGGEVNICFEYLRGVDFQPPMGIRISEFTFDFSIPYTGCDEAEFAARLLFYLKKATHGVDSLDYFRSIRKDKKKEENPRVPALILTQVEGMEKLKCDCSRWWQIKPIWSIYLNKHFEFEVYYGTTLFATYKSFVTAIKRLGVTQY